jgi:hypothetical protein
MLGGRHGRLFLDTLVPRHQVIWIHRLDLWIAKIVAEAPVILSSDEPLIVPFVVSPPHSAQGEELFHFLGVVLIELLGVIRITVVRMVFIGLRGRVIVRIRVLNATTIGIAIGSAVIEQERLVVPIEPEILIFVLLVDLVVKILHDRNARPIESPETELGNVVSFRFHFQHGWEDDIPFIPVTYCVRHIHHQDIDAGVCQHGHILSDDILVFAEKIPNFRFAPMVAASGPERVLGIQSRRWICGQHFGHVGGVRALQIRAAIAVPGDIEDSNHPALVMFGRPDFGKRGHGSTQGICGHPRIGKDVAVRGFFRTRKPIRVDGNDCQD